MWSFEWQKVLLSVCVYSGLLCCTYNPLCGVHIDSFTLLWQPVLISCIICRFVETSCQKATWVETDCDISDIRCSKVLTVFFWSSDLHDPRTYIPSRSSLYEGTWDRLSWCITYYSHADSSTWTSRYSHLCPGCGQIYLHLCVLLWLPFFPGYIFHDAEVIACLALHAD